MGFNSGFKGLIQNLGKHFDNFVLLRRKKANVFSYFSLV